MTRYKFCPACNAKNPEEEAICCSCCADISNAPVRHEERAGSSHAGTPAAEDHDKKCPKCGNSNPSYSVICDECRCDMTETEALPASGKSLPDASNDAKSGSLSLVLASAHEKIRIDLADGDIFGRCDRCDPPRSGLHKCSTVSGTRDFVDCLRYDTVSRKHAQFFFENGKFFVMPVAGSVNETWLNGEELRRGERYELKNGDRIKFSSRLEMTVLIRRTK